MPSRRCPIVVDEIYHVFNRSVARVPIFTRQYDYIRGVNLIKYYRHANLPLRYSHYNRLPKDLKRDYEDGVIAQSKDLITIYAFSLMPNHFHFLLRANFENGISIFMRNLQHSYSKYFNTKYERTGTLIQSMFKAVRIESEEQLIHVSRYVHINSVTAYIIKIEDLATYPWTSFGDYIRGSNPDSFVDTSLVLAHFSSRAAYRDFVYDQVDYQRELAKIKHLLK